MPSDIGRVTWDEVTGRAREGENALFARRQNSARPPLVLIY